MFQCDAVKYPFPPGFLSPVLVVPERIEGFIEGQAFLRGRMIRLHAQTLPPSPISKLDRRHIGRLRKRGNLLKEEGEGGGRGAESCERKKAWSSINHSILSMLCSGFVDWLLLMLQ
jgi:hypothetical protein